MITLDKVTKIYKGSDFETKALCEVSLVVEEGDFIAIMGPSGSGKTTLLNVIGCMDTITEGNYILLGEDVSGYSSKQLTEVRKNHISFVFQNFTLMPDYTVYENVEVPLLAKNIRKKERKQKVLDKLELLGIRELANKLPSQISGGQQQRAAIARAMVADNPIILADEPTGALDQKTSKDLMKIFKKINYEGKTIILITHDRSVAECAGRIVHIVDGKLEEEMI